MAQIIVEGSIGVGKSMFLTEAENFFDNSFQTLHIAKEPINRWTSYDGINLLGGFNESPMEFCFKFELLVMLTMSEIHDLSGPGNNNPVILERSLFSAFEVFVESQQSLGYLDDTEYNLLRDYYLTLKRALCRKRPDLVIYLMASPGTLMKRVQLRGRKEENSIITLEYLQELNKKYEVFIKNWEEKGVPVIRINTDADNEVVVEEIKTSLKKIEEILAHRN